MTIEVRLMKYGLSNANNAYVLSDTYMKTIDIPIPDEIKKYLEDGYVIGNVRVKSEGVSNYGYKLS